MNIKITDIFNINITNPKQRFNKEYIIIEINNDYIDDYLTPINQYNGTYIYKLKKDSKISNTFNKIGLDINNYIELGHYIIYDNNNIKILLINRKNGYVTNRYNLIDTVGQLYIWKPVSPNSNFINIGLICTTNPNEVPEDQIGLVPTNHVKIFENSFSDLFQNDYNLLGSNKDNKKKLITYNILNQKNLNDNDSLDNNNLDNLDNLDKIEHFTDSTRKTTENTVQDWTKYQGKSLVLVEANNPWYINKDTTIPIKYIRNDDYFNKGYRKLPNDASYKSNIVLDEYSPSLGYGYSYADRNNIQKVESFDGENKDNSNYIIIIMFVIILLLFYYNIYYKRKNNKRF